MSDRAKGWDWVEPEEYTLVGLAPAFWNGQEWFAHTPWGERFDVLREHGRILAPDEMEGWKMVPVVANDEVLEDGVESLKRGQKLFGDNLTQIVSNIYEDMLAAADGEPT